MAAGHLLCVSENLLQALLHPDTVILFVPLEDFCCRWILLYYQHSIGLIAPNIHLKEFIGQRIYEMHVRMKL